MRFYLDENVSPTLAQILRARGLDVVSSHECGRNGFKDDDQLRLAAEEGRCFVTRDRDHLIDLSGRFSEMGLPHAGVLIVPVSMPERLRAVIATALVEYDRAHPEGISPYTVDFLRPPRP